MRRHFKKQRTLKNLCSSSCAAVGRLAGSLTRHLATTSRMYLEKCFFPVSCSSVGGGFWIVISSTCPQQDAVSAVWDNGSPHLLADLSRPEGAGLHLQQVLLHKGSHAVRLEEQGYVTRHSLHLHGREAGEGRVPVRQLQHRDAEGPDVRQRVVAAGSDVRMQTFRSSAQREHCIHDTTDHSSNRLHSHACVKHAPEAESPELLLQRDVSNR